MTEADTPEVPADETPLWKTWFNLARSYSDLVLDMVLSYAIYGILLYVIYVTGMKIYKYIRTLWV